LSQLSPRWRQTNPHRSPRGAGSRRPYSLQVAERASQRTPIRSRAVKRLDKNWISLGRLRRHRICARRRRRLFSIGQLLISFEGRSCRCARSCRILSWQTRTTQSDSGNPKLTFSTWNTRTSLSTNSWRQCTIQLWISCLPSQTKDVPALKRQIVFISLPTAIHKQNR
jgi:hypothetical protein